MLRTSRSMPSSSEFVLGQEASVGRQIFHPRHGYRARDVSGHGVYGFLHAQVPGSGAGIDGLGSTQQVRCAGQEGIV